MCEGQLECVCGGGRNYVWRRQCVGCVYICMCACASISMYLCPQEEDSLALHSNKSKL